MHLDTQTAMLSPASPLFTGFLAKNTYLFRDGQTIPASLLICELAINVVTSVTLKEKDITVIGQRVMKQASEMSMLFVTQK